MLRNFLPGKARLTCLLILVIATQFLAKNAVAQSRLIHYWNFNTFTSVIHLPATANLAADYSTLSTTTARLAYTPIPTGVSAAYLGFSDFGTSSGSDFDTVNTQFASPGGNYFRARNPTDSMQLLLYIPSTNYQNINIRYGTQSSSLTSGDSAQIFAYSLDSGATWNTAGLSVPSWSLNTTPYLTFQPVSVTINDPLAANNNKLVFRITMKGRNTGTSGNNRFDNITVKGDTILPSQTCLYLWHFNTFTGSYANPNFPYLAPNYFIHDSSKAKVHMGLFPGTSLTNPVFFDVVTAAGTDFDTVNSNWSSIGLGVLPGGNGIRPRNPLDSAYLYYYMPTDNYKNIVLTWAAQTSSFGSGDSCEVFSYSVDSGATWRISGLSKLTDSALLVFKKIQVTFTDPAVNNCSKLVFRIAFKGRNTGTSGNNRFDNVSVQGDSIITPAPTLTTTPAAFGPFCNTTSSIISVPFTTSAPISGSYAVQLSNANGVFPTDFTSNIIGTGTTSPISATIPSGTLPGIVYRVRVITAYPGIFGSDNGSDITIAGVAAPISGPSTVCAGGTITLTEVGGGTWSSTNTALAAIGSGTGIVTGVAPGVDTIIFNVGAGCTASKTITVNPTAAPIVGSSTVCITTTTLLTDATGTGTWTSSASAIASIGSASGIMSGVAVGSARITYTIPSGCFVTLPVTVNPLPSAITGTTVLCQGTTTTLTDAGGGTWASGSPSVAVVGSTGVVTGVSGGTAVITYALPTGCTATTPVTVNPTPSAITGSLTGCVGTTTPLSDLTAFGAWSSATPGVATIGSSTGIVTGASVGTTVISYTVSTGCFTTATMTINSLPSSITGTMVLCAGATTALSNATTGGTWSSSNTAQATVGSTGIVTGVAAGNPTISYMLPTGCMATQVITINPLPATIGGATSVYCIGSTANLTDATPGGIWTSGNPSVATVGSASGIVTGVAAGTAIVTYALPTGCIATITENITSSPAAITGPSSQCVGATTNLSDVTAFGAWTSSNPAIATVGSGTGIVTGVAVGTATITYSLSSFCQTTKTVTVNTPPQAITGITTVCAGLTTALTDTGSGFWTSSVPSLASVNASTGVVTGVAAGNPTITFTAPSGCSATTLITVNASPLTINGTGIVCTGTSLTLTNATAGGVWSASNANLSIGSATGLVTGVSLGTATVTYTISNGCYVTKAMTVYATPAAILGTNFACAGQSSTLTNATSGGTWSSSVAALASVGSATGVVAAVAAGNPVISYTMPTGCYSSIVYTVNPLPSPIGGTTSVYCIGSSATLFDASAGGTWSSSDLGVSTVGSTSGVVTGIAGGDATITYTLPTGCFTTLPQHISSTPAIISGPSSTCVSTTIGLTDSTAFGAWSSSNTSVATIGSGTGYITGVASGTTTITYQLSPICLITKTITVNALPSAIGGVAQTCIGTTTTLTDAGSGTWTSSIPALASVGASTGVVTGIVAGNVDITYTLPTGCYTTTPLTVNPLPTITAPTTICLGLPTTLTGTTGGGTWASSNTAVATIGSATGSILGSTLGTTTITYTLPTGCLTTLVVTVSPPPSPIVGATQVCAGLSTTLSDVGGGGWYSSNPSVATIGFGSGIVNAVSAGTTTITYTTGTSCISISVLTVNPLPAAISGLTTVCPGVPSTLSDATTGGSWTSGTTTVATVGASSGIVTGIVGGSSMITYTLPTGCIATTNVSVNPVTPITGTMVVCAGSISTLSNSVSGGTWTSGNPSIAAIGGLSGVLAGLAAGNAAITYTLPGTGCIVTAVVTINPLPASIVGVTNVCQGSTTTLTEATTGGTWTSDDVSTAIVGSTGIVSGVSNGTCNISYTLSTGCKVGTNFTVNYLPASITGTLNVCVGSTNTLLDATAGGSWTSSTPSVATIASATGIASGVSSGTSAITYTLPTGCLTSANLTVNPLPNVDTVTGGGAFCAGGAGIHIRLSGSDVGINYQLYRGTSTVGSPVAGSGSLLDFGLQTTGGTYTVIAKNATTTCSSNMYGSKVITVNPLPVIHTVTGGGHFCFGDPGVAVGLAGSDTGINYQLYRGTSTVGAPLAGVGSSLSYGIQSTVGNYTVVGTNSGTGCTATMAGTATVSIDTLYTPVVVVTAHPATIKYGQNDTLTATVTNGGPVVAYQWVVNSTYIAGATTNTYIRSTYQDKDTVTCFVTSTSPCGSVIGSDTVIIAISNVGVKPVVSLSSNIALVPNPNRGVFKLTGTLATTDDQDVSVTVTDVLGKVVYTSSFKTSNGQVDQTIQVDKSIANGTYILNLRTEKESKAFHIVFEQ